MTVFWSKKGSPYTENPCYCDIPLTVTLFARPNTVTVSGEACIIKNRNMETAVFQPGICTFGVKRKLDGKELHVLVKWSVSHDSEGCEDDFSVSIEDGHKLVGFASYHDSSFINWTSSKLDS